MRIIRTIFISTLATLLIVTHIYAIPTIQHTAPQVMPLTTDFEVNVNGTMYSVQTPSSPASAPITVKIIKNNQTVFQQVTRSTSMVVSDGIDWGVSNDAADYRLSNDGNHVLKILQNGVVIFQQQL